MARRWIALPVVMLALIAAACARGPARSTSRDQAGDEPVRTARIEMKDTLRFAPDRLKVRKGDTVRFVVSNAGKLPHEFVLADEEIQEAHEQAMAEAGDMGHEGMADMDMHGDAEEPMARLTVGSGETKEVTVTFTEEGDLLFGCHLEGHYKAGMLGKVDVT